MQGKRKSLPKPAKRRCNHRQEYGGPGYRRKLGEGVKELGGLAVIGTERPSRRIDNQLRGRSGRQGIRASQSHCRWKTLMRRFGSDNMKAMMERFGMDDSQPIQ